MFLLLSLASSAALLAPGPGRRGVPRLLESSTTACSPPLMNQAPTGPAGEVANAGSVVKRWLASRCLPFAVLSGNVGFGKMLIKAGANLETMMVGDEFTPLEFAVVLGSVGLVEALAEGGASLEAPVGESDGSTPLQIAIFKGDVGVGKVLIEAGASLEAMGGIGVTPLQCAITFGNLDTIKADIEAKASLEAACGFESTPLQLMVSDGSWPSAMAYKADGNLDAVKMLVKAGASLKAAGEQNITALEYAIDRGNVDVIKALIQASGSLEAVERGSKLTAMELAIGIGNSNVEQLIEALIEAGASVDGAGGNTPTLLQMATVKGNVGTIRLLIDAGASLEGVGGDGTLSTPLKLAVGFGNVDTVEALLEAGASLEAVNEHDLTPREYAAKLLAEEEGNADVLKALVDAEAARGEARDVALRAIRDALE